MKTRQPRYKQIYAIHEDGEEKAILASSIWAEIIEHLKEINFLSAPRAALADRYVRARVEYEFLYSEGTKTGPTKKGKKGGEYANMTWAAIKNLSDQIAKFEDALLIAPKASGGTALPPQGSDKKTPAHEFID